MSDNPKNFPMRKFLKTIGRLLINSWFIAALLGVLTFLLIDFSLDPYVFEVQRETTISAYPKDLYTFYADLNSDGVQDRFYFSNNTDQNSVALVFKNGNITEDQWNFLGEINLFGVGYYVGNYDKDSYSEIVNFSVRERSIYLNIIEPFDDHSHLVKNRLVDTIATSVLNFEFYTHNARFFDLNQDGFDELVFSLSVGLALQPRKTYIYDIKADSLWSSPLIGTSLKNSLIIDYDRDGEMEFFCENNSSNNYSTGQINYPDTASWFAVLDEQLHFKVPPVPVGRSWSHVFPILFEKKNKQEVILFVTREKCCQWYRVNTDFTLTQTPLLQNRFAGGQADAYSSASGQGLMIHDLNDQLLFVLQQESISDSVNLQQPRGIVPILNYQAGMRQIEYAFHMEGRKEYILFLDRNGKRLGQLDVESGEYLYRICWTGSENGRPQFLLSGQKFDSWVSVTRNTLRYWQYLFLLLLIAGFYIFILAIRSIQARQFARQESLRKEVLELQLKAVRNQLDPHFIFNALNTLSGLSLTGDKKGVDHFIRHFSQLLRTHLQTSDKILVPLKEEVEFLVNYVELQRIRFENAFRLQLDISSEVDQGRAIPKMMIQTHVENAIKHGLKEGEGRILVWIRGKKNSLIIVIEDNGVGRGNSRVPAFESTGKGLIALEKIRESVKELYGIRVHQEIVDLFNADGKPAGTRVIVTIEN